MKKDIENDMNKYSKNKKTIRINNKCNDKSLHKCNVNITLSFD